MVKQVKQEIHIELCNIEFFNRNVAPKRLTLLNIDPSMPASLGILSQYYSNSFFRTSLDSCLQIIVL